MRPPHKEKGDGSLLCGAPDGPFRQKTPVPFFLEPWGEPPPLRPLHAQDSSALAAVYERADAALASEAASCRACGECCRFGPDRPVLFASALELAYLTASAGRPAPDRVPKPGGPDAPWQCPYQEGAQCTARAGRAMGCRTYFCDPASRRRGEEVHAEAFDEIRRIAGRRKEGWWYGPARFFFSRGA